MSHRHLDAYADQAEYKQALSRLAASVAVVTVQDGWRARAVTVSSLVSVSLSPKLVSFCLSVHGRTTPLLAIGKDIGISVLSTCQLHLARRFSLGDRAAANFREESGVCDWNGVWVFEDSSAWFAGTVESITLVGDHYLYVIRSNDAAAFPRDVLTYFDRNYGSTRRLMPEPPRAITPGETP